MNQRKWERVSALAGVVAMTLIVLAAFLPSIAPTSDASAAAITRFVADHNGAVRWAGFLGSVGSVVLLVWIGAVWRLMRGAESGSPLLAVTAALGLTFGFTLITIPGVALSAMAIVGPRSLDPSVTRFVYVFISNLGQAGALGIALFMAAFAAVIVRTSVLPRVLGRAGAVIALLLLLAGGGVASTHRAFVVFTALGYFGFVLWSVVVSVLMYRIADAGTPLEANSGRQMLRSA